MAFKVARSYPQIVYFYKQLQGPIIRPQTRAFGLKGLGGLQPPQGKIFQLVGMKIEPLSAQE